jgi:hypothetical protein
MIIEQMYWDDTGVIHATGTLTEQMYKVKTPKIEVKSETPKLL